MPLPKPSKGQTLDEWISACMGHETMKKDYPDTDQRLAVCFSQWEQVHGKSDNAVEDVAERSLIAAADFHGDGPPRVLWRAAPSGIAVDLPAVPDRSVRYC